MGVYIKGMEMPKNCHNCELSTKVNLEYGNGYFCQILAEMIANTHERKANCPLIEVPEPHGRLIDVDALMAKVEHDTPLSDVYEKTMRRYLGNAPTVIPASEVET